MTHTRGPSDDAYTFSAGHHWRRPCANRHFRVSRWQYRHQWQLRRPLRHMVREPSESYGYFAGGCSLRCRLLALSGGEVMMRIPSRQRTTHGTVALAPGARVEPMSAKPRGQGSSMTSMRYEGPNTEFYRAQWALATLRANLGKPWWLLVSGTEHSAGEAPVIWVSVATNDPTVRQLIPASVDGFAVHVDHFVGATP